MHGVPRLACALLRQRLLRARVHVEGVPRHVPPADPRQDHPLRVGDAGETTAPYTNVCIWLYMVTPHPYAGETTAPYTNPALPPYTNPALQAYCPAEAPYPNLPYARLPTLISPAPPDKTECRKSDRSSCPQRQQSRGGGSELQ